MESILKKTSNWYRCVGHVYEKALTKEDCKVKIYKDGKPTGDEVDAECIKGSVAVKTDNGIVTFNVYFASMNMQGEPSKDWAMAQAMMDKWNPIVNGNGDEPTLVNIEGSVEPNDYKNPTTNKLVYNLRYRIRRANTRVNPDDAQGMSIRATCYINKIIHEVRNEEETGRLLVELLAANNKGECFPIPTIVEEDLADTFESVYEPEQTVNFDIDVFVKHIGGQKSDKRAFGKKSAVSVNSGFDVTELIIVGADDPIEEPDELTTVNEETGEEVEVPTNWINPVTMKKAIKMRRQKLDEMEKNGSTYKKSGESFADKKAKKASQMKTNTMPKPKEPYHDEAPFDTDEEEDF